MATFSDIRGCLSSYIQAIRAAKQAFGDAVDACKATAKAQIDQCGTLLPADEVACIQQAMIALQNCLDQAILMRNGQLQAADAQLRMCLMQVSIP